MTDLDTKALEAALLAHGVTLDGKLYKLVEQA